MSKIYANYHSVRSIFFIYWRSRKSWKTQDIVLKSVSSGNLVIRAKIKCNMKYQDNKRKNDLCLQLKKKNIGFDSRPNLH